MEANLRRLHGIQQEHSLKRVNHLADSCFDVCIADMAFTKHLKNHELECIKKCAQKYMKIAALAGNTFATAGSDIQVDEHET